jgi:hypothetical protein
LGSRRPFHSRKLPWSRRTGTESEIAAGVEAVDEEVRAPMSVVMRADDDMVMPRGGARGERGAEASSDRIYDRASRREARGGGVL